MNKDAIKIDQDPLGKMGFRLHSTATSQTWARPLADGSVAVALYNKGGGTPAGVVIVESEAYCSGKTIDFGFGHTLQTCRDAVQSDIASGGLCDSAGLFYYSEVSCCSFLRLCYFN